jgi:hypothetical protein
MQHYQAAAMILPSDCFGLFNANGYRRRNRTGVRIWLILVRSYLFGFGGVASPRIPNATEPSGNLLQLFDDLAYVVEQRQKAREYCCETYHYRGNQEQGAGSVSHYCGCRRPE